MNNLWLANEYLCCHRIARVRLLTRSTPDSLRILFDAGFWVRRILMIIQMQRTQDAFIGKQPIQRLRGFTMYIYTWIATEYLMKSLCLFVSCRCVAFRFLSSRRFVRPLLHLRFVSFRVDTSWKTRKKQTKKNNKQTPTPISLWLVLWIANE